jgi:hypothetical protein
MSAAINLDKFLIGLAPVPACLVDAGLTTVPSRHKGWRFGQLEFTQGAYFS